MPDPPTALLGAGARAMLVLLLLLVLVRGYRTARPDEALIITVRSTSKPSKVAAGVAGGDEARHLGRARAGSGRRVSLS